MLEVVSAAIITRFEDCPRILLTQRASGVSFPWRWCTPGGKVEEGEGLLDALARELREEICLHADPGMLSYVPIYEHLMKRKLVDALLRISCFELRLRKIPPEIRPMLSQSVVGMGWFAQHELDSLNLAGADKENVGILKALLWNFGKESV